MVQSRPGPSLAKIEDGGRIRIPADLGKRLEWLSKTEKKSAWLFLHQSGRCRLFSPAEVDDGPLFRELRAHLEEPEARSQPDDFEPAGDVALSARLFETTVEPHRGGWRLTLHPEVTHLLDSSNTPAFVYIMFSGGFVEIWGKEFLFRQQSTPLSRV